MLFSHRAAPAALACLLLAAAIPFCARTIIGPPGALVHVRWAASADESARRALEQRFHLIDGQQQDEHTWRYDLREATTANIRALVRERTVEDTHYIDRSGYAIDAMATRTARPQRFVVSNDVIVSAADAIAVFVLAIAVFLLIGPPSAASRVAALGRRLGSALGNVTRSLSHWLAQFIPEIDATALGWFRAALGCGFVWVALSRQLVAVPLQQQRHRALFDLDVVHRIAASQAACNAIELAMLVAAILFAAGAFARVTYGMFVAAFALSTLVTLERTSAHDLGLPLVTYLGWLTIPWSAGRVFTGRAFSHAPQRSYGFALWWPGLTLGLALLAAAYWKLHQSGLAWITGGAVKYHFVTDSANAQVDWGLWVAIHPWAAVFFSLGAIVMEAVFIVNIFARGPWTRLAAGALGASLYVALYLLQGIYWPAWHVLFLAFLPWSILNAAPAERGGMAQAPSRPQIRMAQGLVVLTLVGAQAYASATGTEAEPLLSHFPMYAYTYDSVQQFEASMRPHMTRVVAARADGQDISSTLPALADDDRLRLIDLAEQTGAQTAGLTEPERRNRVLLCQRYQRETSTLPTEIAFTIERKGFDWSSGRFRDYQPVPTTPVHLAALCQQVFAAQ
jgi:hypothetical protein